MKNTIILSFFHSFISIAKPDSSDTLKCSAPEGGAFETTVRENADYSRLEKCLMVRTIWLV